MVASLVPTYSGLWGRKFLMQRVKFLKRRIFLLQFRNISLWSASASTAHPHGAIAQLGERVTGSHEVGGSRPPGSTTKKPAFLEGWFLCFDRVAGSPPLDRPTRLPWFRGLLRVRTCQFLIRLDLVGHLLLH